jgi:hypothetical protein
MHKLTKKIFIGSSILLLVFMIAQNLEADKLSSTHATDLKTAMGFETYKEDRNQAYPINYKDSLSVLRHSLGIQSSIQVAKDTNKTSLMNIEILEEVRQLNFKREALKVQHEINVRMKELLQQPVVRPK